jgi:hypothetical protein
VGLVDSFQLGINFVLRPWSEKKFNSFFEVIVLWERFDIRFSVVDSDDGET